MAFSLAFGGLILAYHWQSCMNQEESTFFICKVVVIVICLIFYCDPFILISCLYCYFRPVTCSYAGFRLAVRSYPRFINFIGMHMQLCWLVASDMQLSQLCSFMASHMQLRWLWLLICSYPSFVRSWPGICSYANFVFLFWHQGSTNASTLCLDMVLRPPGCF